MNEMREVLNKKQRNESVTQGTPLDKVISNLTSQSVLSLTRHWSVRGYRSSVRTGQQSLACFHICIIYAYMKLHGVLSSAESGPQGPTRFEYSFMISVFTRNRPILTNRDL